MNRERWDKFERKMDRFSRRMDRVGDRFEQRRWGRCGPQNPGRHLVAGVIFVAIGLVFLLGNMGVLDSDRILRYWPVILVAVGIFRLVESGPNYRQSSGIFWIVTGGLLLMGSLGILRVGMRDFWPLLLIGFGSLMLWRTVLARQGLGGGNPPRPNAGPASGLGETQAPPGPGTENSSSTGGAASSNSTFSATAILGGVERRNNSQDFRGGSATAFMGGCEIDLRAANITPPNEPVIEVFAMWGGVEVRVPPDWTVMSQVDPIMGGFEDATEQPKEETKRVWVRGTVIMGGVEVRN
jgi:hypothetical protein